MLSIEAFIPARRALLLREHLVPILAKVLRLYASASSQQVQDSRVAIVELTYLLDTLICPHLVNAKERTEVTNCAFAFGLRETILDLWKRPECDVEMSESLLKLCSSILSCRGVTEHALDLIKPSFEYLCSTTNTDLHGCFDSAFDVLLSAHHIATQFSSEICNLIPFLKAENEGSASWHLITAIFLRAQLSSLETKVFFFKMLSDTSIDRWKMVYLLRPLSSKTGFVEAMLKHGAYQVLMNLIDQSEPGTTQSNAATILFESITSASEVSFLQLASLPGFFKAVAKSLSIEIMANNDIAIPFGRVVAYGASLGELQRSDDERASNPFLQYLYDNHRHANYLREELRQFFRKGQPVVDAFAQLDQG